MRIGISARGLSIKSGGAKEYIRRLLTALGEIDSENEYFLYYSTPDLIGSFKYRNFREVVPGQKFAKLWRSQIGTFIWDEVILPWQLRRDKIDVVLFPKYIIPLLNTTPAVISILDLAYFFPELNAYKFWDVWHKKILLPLSMIRAQKVLAISQNTKQDILRLFPHTHPEKVEVTYLAAAYQNAEVILSQDEIIKKYGQSLQKYIFLSSSLSPRKNIPRAIQALALIKDKIPHQFVITGGKAWNTPKVKELLTELGLEDRFTMLGFVPDEDMQSLFHHADLYLHPSLYEGFSITLLEAMSAGTAVVASNASCHPEIAGDAAAYFDPYNVEEMAAAILKVAQDPILQHDLIAKGRLQAQKFSWQKCAKETLDVLESVGKRNN